MSAATRLVPMSLFVALGRLFWARAGKEFEQGTQISERRRRNLANAERAMKEGRTERRVQRRRQSTAALHDAGARSEGLEDRRRLRLSAF